MTELARVLNIYIDADLPGGAEARLSGTSSNLSPTHLRMMQNDCFTVRLYFRRRATSIDGVSTVCTWPTGAVIILAAKAASAAGSADPLVFICDAFTIQSGDNPAYYEGTLDLATEELRAAIAALAANQTALTCSIDIEVRNAANTERLTYRVTVDVMKDVYDSDSNPSALGSPSYRMTSPGGIIFQLSITDDGELQIERV